MSNLAGSSIYSSTNTSSSTLRPRNNRLISYLEESTSDNDILPQSRHSSSSRGPSPAAANSHAHSLAQSTERSDKQSYGHVSSENGGRRSSSLWDPWSSIQGVASSLLGGGEASSSLARKGSNKTPVWMKQESKFKTTPAAPKWGPDGKEPAKKVPTSIEERQALVQAKRREALLLKCAQEGRDELGHFKRKASYEADSNDTTTETDLGQEALVYRHKVQPQDTLAGVSIKYNCQPEAFRKLNRFWPNDNIQTRKFVLLPVEACSIRGRKVDDATSLELLANQLNQVELDVNQRSVSGKEQHSITSASSSFTATPKQLSLESEGWKHDSYVVLPCSSDPVEILRIPRKTLGYFPRTRRKSIQQLTDSVTSTPKTSFDMLRHPPTHAAQQAAAAQSLALNTSPIRRPQLSSTSRERSSSNSNTTTTNSNSNNAWILRGPGGVGDLRGLRTEISRPGPAEDALNQKFAQYFPGLAAQPDNDDNILSTKSKTIAPSRSPYRSTPRASIDSIRSTRSNSSTFGVAGVENFMRKLATGGKRPDLPRVGSGSLINAMGIPISNDTGLGDLIELETNPDALNSAQGRDRSGGVGRSDNDWEDDDATPTEIGKTHEDLLNERFPIRGRITRAYNRDDD